MSKYKKYFNLKFLNVVTKVFSFFLSAIMITASLSGLHVNAASTNIFTYYAITDFGTADVAYAAKIQSNVKGMNYTVQAFNLPRASAIFNNLPKDIMSVIHGHGSYRRLQLDQKKRFNRTYLCSPYIWITQFF